MEANFVAPLDGGAGHMDPRKYRSMYMFASVPTERRHSPFKTHLQNCFRGWSVRNPQISKRGMAHILELYALDEGLKALQKMGGVKHESNKRQRKEREGPGGGGAKEGCMHPHLVGRAQCRQDAEKGTHNATNVWLLKDAGGPGIRGLTGPVWCPDFCSVDGAACSALGQPVMTHWSWAAQRDSGVLCTTSVCFGTHIFQPISVLPLFHLWGSIYCTCKWILKLSGC